MEKTMKHTNKNPEVYLQKLLREHYDFRYNLITEQVEFRKKTDGVEPPSFALLDKRQLNTLCLELLESNVRCWDKDVERFIYSTRIESYHPFQTYMNELPEWDGKDRVEPLIRRITNVDICVSAFYYWLMAMVSQWMGKDSQTGNSIVPILISLEQGLGKSTFCRNLRPHQLRPYFTDMVDLTARGRIDRRLTQNGLINLDEFDRIQEKQMPFLKNLIQVKEVSINKAYHSYFSNLPRIASFIGTSNRTDLLTDPSVIRRFICMEIEERIDDTPFDHDQFYAELKWFIDAGERVWLTHEEEQQLQEHNKKYYRVSADLTLFHQYFKKGTKDHGKWRTLSDMIQYMLKFCSAAKDINPYVLSRELVRIGIRKTHRVDGNFYFVTEQPLVAEG